MRKNFRKAALSTICMLVVAVMSLTGATYAWFTAGETAVVNGMEMKVSAADGGVQVRAYTGDYNFGDVVEDNDVNWTAWMAEVDVNNTMLDAGVAPVSSVDGEHFFQIKTKTIENENKAATDVAEDGNVLIQKIQLKNLGNTEMTVALNNSSDNTYIKDHSTAGATGITGAARVAILVDNPEQEGFKDLYIWAAGTEAAYEGIAAETYETGADADYVAKVNADGFLLETSGVTQTVTLDALEDCKILLPAAVYEDGVSTETPVDVTIVMWFEGQDVDCVNANALGAIEMALRFDKVS